MWEAWEVNVGRKGGGEISSGITCRMICSLYVVVFAGSKKRSLGRVTYYNMLSACLLWDGNWLQDCWGLMFEMVKKKEKGEVVQSRDELLVAIGARVRDLRNAAGLTQKQVADAAGLTQAYIYLVEGGAQNITVTVLSRLAISLGTSIGSFFPEVQHGPPSEESLMRLANVIDKLTEAVEGRRERDTQIVREMEELSASVRQRLGESLLQRNGEGRRGSD